MNTTELAPTVEIVVEYDKEVLFAAIQADPEFIYTLIRDRETWIKHYKNGMWRPAGGRIARPGARLK